jgi:hypothetical protein
VPARSQLLGARSPQKLPERVCRSRVPLHCPCESHITIFSCKSPLVLVYLVFSRLSFLEAGVTTNPSSDRTRASVRQSPRSHRPTACRCVPRARFGWLRYRGVGGVSRRVPREGRSPRVSLLWLPSLSPASARCTRCTRMDRRMEHGSLYTLFALQGRGVIRSRTTRESSSFC